MDPVRVLVVDDHTVFRESLKILLETREDLRVVGLAGDGREAVEVAAAVHPDVVLMDLVMPEMNGVEATRRILKDRPQTLVIALTMYADVESVHDILSAGARGYLVKRVDSAMLFQAIDCVLGGELFLCPAVSQVVVKGFLGHSQNGDGARARGRRPLTRREEEVLKLLAEGLHKKDIAERLYISVRTVEAHRHNVQQKLGMHSLSDLVRYAIRHHMVEP
jgi:DNA-binding NarL/FixJ family response regulator